MLPGNALFWGFSGFLTGVLVWWMGTHILEAMTEVVDEALIVD